VVVSTTPDYSKRKRTAKQKASSGRFAAAVGYFRQVKADPVKYAAAVRRAKRQGLTTRGLIIREFMANGPG
jgi:hypothetical protein